MKRDNKWQRQQIEKKLDSWEYYLYTHEDFVKMKKQVLGLLDLQDKELRERLDNLHTVKGRIPLHAKCHMAGEEETIKEILGVSG